MRTRGEGEASASSSPEAGGSTQGSPHEFIAVLAGGSGTRLWPLSRVHRPKQLLALTNERSLLQNTVARIRLLVPPERILILTEGSHADELREQVPEIPPENILVEPARRGTAGALALGAALIQKRDPDAVMASVHSDHFISNDAEFASTLGASMEAARSLGLLMTMGIQPSGPSTQLGYIEAAEQTASVGDRPVHRVARFVEKPDRKRAEEYLASGRFFWNPGLFAWRVDVLLDEFKRLQPGIHQAIVGLADALGTRSQDQVLEERYPLVPVETIDVGILERSDRIGMIPASFGWADIGSWAELYDVLPKDEHGNVARGEHLALETHNTLTFSPSRIIATIGVEDFVVIDTGDVVLVCPRARAQDARRLVELLELAGRTELL